MRIDSRPLRACAVALVVLAGCSREAPATEYPLTGQILAVDVATRQITIKHGDIPNLMPAMTMTFPVAPAELLAGRAPGDLVTGTLEVREGQGRIVALTKTGTAPLPADDMASALLDPGDEIPDVALIDQSDRRRSLAEWRGQWTLITFTYTRCPLPTFCPLMDQNFATLQQRLSEDPDVRGRVRLVTITMDPEHDTPAVLAAHAARLKADPAVWTFLTGDRVTIDRLAQRFGVGIVRDADPAQITHNLRTSLVGPDARLIKVYGGNDWTPGAVLADLRQAVRRASLGH
jgi:protein SCO1/2